MSNNIRLFFITLMFFATSSLLAETGMVVLEKNYHYIIDTEKGYTVAEWYGGSTLLEGDIVVGKLNSYGFKDIYNKSTGKETKVYIDDYMLTEKRALDKVYK